MARQTNRLTARSVLSIATPGRHADGGNLYLVVDANGAKRWSFLFRWEGKLREMGLGGLTSVSLARARELAANARKLVADGKNPIDQRKLDKPMPTFGEVADDLISTMSPQWRNEKHRDQWKMTLTVYAKSLRSLPVDTIQVEHVLKALKPIWQTRPETASRLRGRIESVLDAAKSLGHRSGENPAAWRGNLKNLLPPPRKLARGHHAAMPYKDVPAFVGQLRENGAVSAFALEFIILTAARSGEALGAPWGEIDLAEKVWTIPAGRMKSNREHRVPLSARAIEILSEMKKLRVDDQPDAYVFPGARKKRPLSNMAPEMLMRRLEVDVTTHGFRSSFRDWAGDATNFPRELAEAALAHAVGDEVEQAYRRSDALAKRRKMMDAWSSYLSTKLSAKIIPMKRS